MEGGALNWGENCQYCFSISQAPRALNRKNTVIIKVITEMIIKLIIEGFLQSHLCRQLFKKQAFSTLIKAIGARWVGVIRAWVCDYFF